MARIIVTTDPGAHSADNPVLLEESVYSVHLSTDHASKQLIERLGWALNDAEEIESTRSDRGRGASSQEDRHERARPRRGATRARRALPA
jgi:hypothetical protein